MCKNCIGKITHLQYVEFTVVSRRYIKLIIHLGFYYLSIPFVWGYWSNPFNIWLRCWILGIQILTQTTLIPPLCIPLCWGCRFYSWPYRPLGQHGLWSSLYPLWFGTTPDSVPSFGDLPRPGVLQNNGSKLNHYIFKRTMDNCLIGDNWEWRTWKNNTLWSGQSNALKKDHLMDQKLVLEPKQLFCCLFSAPHEGLCVPMVDGPLLWLYPKAPHLLEQFPQDWWFG